MRSISSLAYFVDRFRAVRYEDLSRWRVGDVTDGDVGVLRLLYDDDLFEGRLFEAGPVVFNGKLEHFSHFARRRGLRVG